MHGDFGDCDKLVLGLLLTVELCPVDMLWFSVDCQVGSCRLLVHYKPMPVVFYRARVASMFGF